MSRIQDIRAFANRIDEAVNEYLAYPESYENPVLHIYLDRDEMEYKAEIAENLQGTEEDGVYPIASVIRKNEDGRDESDCDRIDEIANSWVFLDHWGKAVVTADK